MSSSAKMLLAREYKSLKSRPKSNYFQVYDLVSDNIMEWIVFIIGPPKTFYSGGIFKARMKFPDNYPMEPPSVQFLCSILHPNVYRDGKVCISTLQVPPPENDCPAIASLYWRPIIGVEQALLSVISLLSDPNHEDAASPAATTEWLQNPESFRKKMKKLKEQAKELVPADFMMPIVLDSTERVKPEVEEESDHTACDEDFVYSSEEEEEEEDENDFGSSDCKQQIANSVGILSKPADDKLQTRRESDTLKNTSNRKSSDGDKLKDDSPKARKDRATSPFIKSSVGDLPKPPVKRHKLCK